VVPLRPELGDGPLALLKVELGDLWAKTLVKQSGELLERFGVFVD